MTEIGFRDLFVELPRALFDALQAIGEAAVERARPPIAATPPPFAWFDRFVAALRHHYGWREFLRVECHEAECWRALVVRLSCGHVQRYMLDELAMLRAPSASAALVDLVCSAIENTERHCQCVQLPTEWSR